MRRLFLVLLIVQLTSSSYGQVSVTSQSRDELALERISLISDLQVLEARAGQLEKVLARASAKAEIADAAWTLDKDWAERLLREAYQLTFPSEEAQAWFRQVPVGALVMPTATDNARWVVRQRVMSIAGRDAAFAEELVRLGAEHLGRQEEHQRYSELAEFAARRGDLNDAARYVRQAFEAEPTQGAMLPALYEVAAQDRATADKLIIQYIEHLNSVSLSFKDGSDWRVLYILGMLTHPSPTYPETGGRQIAPPSAAAMHAWVGFMLDYIVRGEQRQPGSLQRSREFLLGLWPELKKYAPDLIGRFREMEMLSRRPGDKVSWPPPDTRESFRKRKEELTKNLVESGEADPGVITLLIDRGEIAGARRLLDKLADGPPKTDLLNKLDAKEAVSLVKKGDLAGAQVLAGRLTKASYILQAYPAIIEKCISNKDKNCAASVVYQATRQLKQSDVTPPVLPPGIPASVLPTGREFDPVLSSLCKLAQLILPVDDSLAFDVLNEMVASANTSEVDTGQGRTGFDADIFKRIAHSDEARARQAASSFKDPLRQIVSLSAIYSWKAAELNLKAKANGTGSPR
jgi:hypothetical protein